MAANAERLIQLAMVPELAKEVAAQIDSAVSPGEITNAMIAADADIATSKLADGTEIAALVSDATPLATLAAEETELTALVAADAEILALAALDTELTALANSDLVTAVGAPPAYSEVAADLAAALVAAGLMQASA